MFEATSALTIITSGMDAEKNEVVEKEESQALLALTNIVVESLTFGDAVLAEEAVDVLMTRFDSDAKLSLSRQVAAALFAFCDRKSSPSFDRKRCLALHSLFIQKIRKLGSMHAGRYTICQMGKVKKSKP
ncbi:hypothetical protein L1987_52812 [Smallanthus sonchifolius]|uniref:Uncharacterized protein n=1 Tax=Smallanthus sonchifolius TaxID=185202 RepID=A0ACB9ETJ1_9ASTR|nr:hypothetical protein L1987_52812 [Smallanthus sonchifolius]